MLPLPTLPNKRETQCPQQNRWQCECSNRSLNIQIHLSVCNVGILCPQEWEIIQLVKSAEEINGNRCSVSGCVGVGRFQHGRSDSAVCTGHLSDFECPLHDSAVASAILAENLSCQLGTGQRKGDCSGNGGNSCRVPVHFDCLWRERFSVQGTSDHLEHLERNFCILEIRKDLH